MDISSGTIIEQKYRIEEKLGEGSSSIVYKAVDIDLNKVVALKFLREELAILPSRRKRFLRESRIAARFIHPAVLPVRAIGEWQKTLYLVIDFHAGKTLRTLLREKQLSLSEVAQLSQQMLVCLVEAHKIGLVHGDIKPANLMIKEEGQTLKLSVVDFGLASSADDPDSSKKASGTPNYMAPEILLGDAPTPASDIYSASMCIYEMLTKRLPFSRNDNENTPLYSILNQDPVPPSRYRRVPKMINKVMNKALAISVTERYSTAQEFLNALETAWQSRYHFSTRQMIAVFFLVLLGLVSLQIYNHYGEHRRKQEINDYSYRLLSEKKFKELRIFLSNNDATEISSFRTLLWKSLWEEFICLLPQSPTTMEAFFQQEIWQNQEFQLLQQYMKYYYTIHQINEDCNQKNYETAIHRCRRFSGTPSQNYIIQNIKKRLEIRNQESK